MTEVITDLRNIGALGYEEDENQQELEEDALSKKLQNMSKVSVQLCYITFVASKETTTENDKQDEQRTLH